LGPTSVSESCKTCYKQINKSDKIDATEAQTYAEHVFRNVQQVLQDVMNWKCSFSKRKEFIPFCSLFTNKPRLELWFSQPHWQWV